MGSTDLDWSMFSPLTLVIMVIMIKILPRYGSKPLGLIRDKEVNLVL